ncbi:hypothetical protein [Thalassoroseus pseudoceratinae]|uniref:hypothetical protein n=1 Tax=Thalassoroseus pseudoceratinae TaxID=2713176 RepID=UPI00141DEFB9|nr:hypothetical protein [Thalassoroseus pseudoceratinae]
MIDTWTRCFVAPALCALVMMGCGGGTEGPETFTVSGTASYNGEPLSSGDIVFRPASGEGQSWAGKIENGKFSFDSTAGDKRVEITAYQEAPAPTQYADSGEGASQVQYIPAEFNSNSTLTETVSDSGDNTFTFDLKGE